jgi:FK506-binding protein 1
MSKPPSRTPSLRADGAAPPATAAAADLAGVRKSLFGAAPEGVRATGDGAVLDGAGGAGAADDDEAERLAALTAELEAERAALARQEAFEALAREFKAGRCAELVLLSGVRMREDAPGDRASFPYTACMVRIHYEVRLVLDSGLPAELAFDSSRLRGAPHDYQHGAGFAIKGLEEALCFMSKGARCRIRVPPAMAYKEGGFPPTIPPNATLLYDVELIAFE